MPIRKGDSRDGSAATGSEIAPRCITAKLRASLFVSYRPGTIGWGIVATFTPMSVGISVQLNWLGFISA